MNNDSKKSFWAIGTVLILVVIVAIAIYASSQSSQSVTTAQTATSTSASIAGIFTFNCDAGKSIKATFINSTASTTTGNSVQLSLSDGEQKSLPQAISADGAR